MTFGPKAERYRTRVKVCGITRQEDARLASALGADAVGIVFAESPRQVDPDTAPDLFRAVGPFVTRVGVFADQPLGLIREVAHATRLDWVQLSGSEPPETAKGVDVSVVKAVHVERMEDLLAHSSYPADWFLLDAPPVRGQMGGTGAPFAWELADRLPWDRGRVIVAGGLTPENVGVVIDRLHPVAVDVSSGVETRPGIKDPAKMEAFIAAVAAADARSGGRRELRE